MNLFIKLVLFITATFVLIHCNPGPPQHKSVDSLKRVAVNKSEYNNTVYEPIFIKLNSGDTLSKTEIEDFSANIETRAEFYALLVKFNKQNIFHRAYYTFAKATESVLTNWLLYPTELDTIPSAIEPVKKVSVIEHDTTFIYYVLRFKTEASHWAAKDGWMLGVVGPYFKNSEPYDWTSGTFSKFTKAKETTPEKEVEWAHKNIYRKSPE